MHFSIRHRMPAEWKDHLEADIPSHIINSFALFGHDGSSGTEIRGVLYAVICPEILRPGRMIDIGNICQIRAVDEQRTDHPFGFGMDQTGPYSSFFRFKLKKR